ncbi:MAG: hypothetical protein ACE5OP_11945 [Candidatus Glassbacteria bacterium]
MSENAQRGILKSRGRAYTLLFVGNVKGSAWGILSLAIGLLLIFMIVGQADTISPQWRAGEAWTVKSIYYHAEAADPFWSEPVFWRFEVKGEETIDGQRCIVIEVHGVDGAEEWSRLLLRVFDHAPFLYEGHLSDHGEEHVVRHRYLAEGPEPVMPRMTIIPLTLPALPLTLPEDPETTVSARYLETRGEREQQPSRSGIQRLGWH